MPGFRFTAFGHFIGLIAYFPCQNCRRFHHYCNNYCWQIAATLKDVHFHCTAYLDWYFRCHDHLMVAWLLHLRLLNMVNLIFYCAYRCPCLHLVFFRIVVQINILLWECKKERIAWKNPNKFWGNKPGLCWFESLACSSIGCKILRLAFINQLFTYDRQKKRKNEFSKRIWCGRIWYGVWCV